jgi:soluble lytic murein transglycosylase-like protein
MSASLIASVENIEAPKAEAPAPVVNETPVVAQALAALACVGEAAPCPPAGQQPPATPSELAQTAAHKYSLPDAFVAGVMRAESGFNPAAVSPKGAIGLMQLMPDTARDLGVDPKNPGQNADAGTRYLRDLLARYENQPNQVELALAAYNAGPAAVDKYHGVPPYRETREYILRVLKSWNPPPVAPATKEASK